MRLTCVTTGLKSTLHQVVLRFQLLIACAVHNKCVLTLLCEIIRPQKLYPT